jgi:hypothetical protein
MVQAAEDLQMSNAMQAHGAILRPVNVTGRTQPANAFTS